MLTADIINSSLFDSENGDAIKSFAIDKDGAAVTTGNKDFGVAVGTGSSLHSKNAALTHATTMADSIALADENEDSYDDTIVTAGYTGYLNLGTYADSTNEVYLDVQVDKGDKITVVAVASEETVIKYALLDATTGEIPSDATPVSKTIASGVTAGSDAAAYVFDFTADDADETDGGIYRIYSEDSDLAIARVYRDSDTTAPNPNPGTPTTYVLDANDLTKFNKGDAADGDEQIAGTDRFFTLIYSASTKIDTSANKTWGVETDEDYFTNVGTKEQRINLGGTASIDKNAIKFITTSAATVKVWWVEGGADNRQIQILDSTGTLVENCESSGDRASGTTYVSTFTLNTAGTYYLGSSVGNNYIFKVTVTNSGYTAPARKAWTGDDSVAAPTLTAEVDAVDAKKVNVTVNSVIGNDGGDKLVVSMYKDDTVVDDKDQTVVINGTEQTLSFTPDASGSYTFKAELSRDGETDKKSATSTAVEFSLPLAKPTGLTVENNTTSADAISVAISWKEVKEATGYLVTVTEAAGTSDTDVSTTADDTPVYQETVTGLSLTLSGDDRLAVGKTYTVSVAAVRAKGEDDKDPDIGEAATGTVDVIVKSGSTVKKKHEFIGTEDLAGYKNDDKFTATYLETGRYFKLVFTEVDDDSKEETVKLTGTATVKSYSTSNLALQLEKYESAAIEFEVKGTADVVIKAMSTGNSNDSAIALKNAAGVEQSEQDNQTTVHGTTETTLNYKGLAKGTYKIVSPKDANNRGVRICAITVEDEYEEGADATTTEYLFDAEDIKDADGNSLADSTLLESGKVYNNYFTVSVTASDGYVKYRTAEQGRPAIGVDLKKQAKASIKFRVIGTADVEIEASSNGDTNKSMIGLVKDDVASADLIQNEQGIRFIDSMNKTKLTYKGLTTGVYYVVSPTPMSQDITDAGDSMGRDTRLYTIKVKETRTGEEEIPRAEWPTEIAVPEIISVTPNSKDESILDVVVDAVVDYYEGGDKITLVMKDKDNNETTYEKMGEQTSHTFDEVTPPSTGTYTFTAFLSRNGENETIPSKNSKTYDYVFPLSVPGITMFYSNGTGANNAPKLRLEWGEVREATSYIINITDKTTGAAILNDVEYTLEQLNGKTALDIEEGLEAGKTYVAKIKAKRAGYDIAAANTTTEYSDPGEAIATGEVETAWNFVIYGLHDGKPSEKNDYTTSEHTGTYNNADVLLDYDDAFVRIWARDGSGKIQPTATDGLAFYYTKVNPQEKNFKLSAVMHVNEWTYSNGQEGFGLMATDRIGTKADESKEFFTNSYQALASKIQYRWDPDKAVVGDYKNVDLPRYEMQLGIGSIEKRGITAANKVEFETDSASATTKYYKYETKTLETSLVNDYGSGKYNIIGGYTAAPSGTVREITDMKLTLELNNTGYFLSYTPVTVAADGTITEDTAHTYTNKYYKRDALSMIEDDGVYVGFFAGRNGDVTFRDVKFTTEDYDPNGPVETQPVSYVTPSFDVTSGSVANNEEYELLFGANWQGTLTMKDEAGNVIIGYDTDLTRAEGETDEAYAVRTGRIEDIYDEELKEYRYEYNMVSKLVNIDIGTNTFYWTFKPDDTDAYNPEPELDDDGNIVRALKQLEDYTTKTGIFTVTYKAYGEEGTALYVSPKGTALGTGTKANPLDIYTAVKYAKPGQTIYLMEGTYNLAKTVTIDRGVDGAPALDADDKETYEKYIYLLPDPSAKERIKFDFSRSCEGIVLAGSYWYISGFDVTRSSLGSDGMRVCGNHNVIDGMNFYDNGNTGLQISRYKGTDTWDYWPEYNLVRNCTSYLNADQGFEDADGFAAKLTIGEGNVFDGCVAAYNADDGWDLFAKPEDGKIGTVVIKNSIAYRNGYVFIKDTDGDGKLSAAEAGAMDRVVSFGGIEYIEYPAGNGNGFKMGGNSLTDRSGKGHRLENSFAFYNRAKGIDSNSAPNIKVKNSVSFNNESYNIALYGKTATNTDFATENVISYRTDDEYYVWEKVGVGYQIKTDDAGNPVKAKYNVKSDNIKTDDVELNGTQITDMSAVYNNSSYYWDAESQGSYTVDPESAKTSSKTPPLKLTDSDAFKTTGTKVAGDWFANVNGYAAFDAAFKADSSSLRNADGTVKMQGFLELTDKAGTSAWEIKSEESPKIEENKNETDGSISSGNAGSEGSSGVRPEDSDKYAEKLIEAKGIATSIGLWFNVVEADEVYYTGKAVRPEVHVYDGTTLLTKKDYTITFKNNVNAWENGRKDNLKNDKKPTIIVKGKGNYLGKADDEIFEIHPVSLNAEDDVFNLISANDITLVSNNRDQAVKPKVTFNNRTLSNANNKDYSFQVYKAKTSGASENPPVENPENPPAENPENPPETTPAEDQETTPEDGSGTTPGTGSETTPGTGSETTPGTGSETTPEAGYGEKITSNKVKDVASYVVELTGHGNYTGTRVINLHVISNTDKDKLASSFKTKLNIREKQREGYEDNYGKKPIPVTLTTTSKDESGKEVSGDLDVRSKSGELLIEGVDYDLSYNNNIEVGMATVTITGKSPKYFGTKSIKFRIAAPRINTMLTDNAKATLKFYKQDAAGTLTGSNGKKYSEFTIKGKQVAYTGSAVTFPGLVIGELPNSDKEIRILQIDKDYTLTYKNNNKAGTASVVVKGVGNYSGSVSKTFRITPLDLTKPGKDENGNDIKVTVSVGGDTNTVSYEKGGSKPTVILRITANGKENKMTLGKDYTVTYRNNAINSVSGNTNPNKKPSVIVRGKGALKGTLAPVTYTVDKKDLSDPNMTITADDVKLSRAGTAGKMSPRIIIKDTNGRPLSAGTDYDRNSITYEKISGNGSIAGKGTINAQGIVDTSNKAATATIASNSDVLVIKVTVKAFAGNDRKSNNCNYSGEISTTFRVGYAKQSIASARVTVNYDKTTYGNGRYFYYNNGNEIKLFDNGRTKDLTVKIGNDELTYNRSGDDSVDGYTIVLDPYSYVNNTKKGTAKVTIRGTGKYTGTKVITYKIGAKEFNWWKNSSK